MHAKLALGCDQPVDGLHKFIGISASKVTPLFFTDVEIVTH